MPEIRFPDGFLWGTATAAHQVEGGNWNNDWWAWEHNPSSGCAEPSGDACDHLSRYPDDIALLRSLGFNTYRFSLEWSRIEPEDGEFSRAALDHYRRMAATCRDNGITPVVTFHHFTTPRWVCHHGGWEEPDTAERFARYVERAAAHLGDLIGWACTINEPNIVAVAGYLSGAFPPGRRDAALRRAVNDIFIDAHHRATAAIKSAASDVPVGLTLAMTDYQAVDGGDDKRASIRRNMEDVYLAAAANDDFLGVQVYSRSLIGPEGARGVPDGAETTQMGYELYPEALEACLRVAWEATGARVPLVVTENGVATDDDERRVGYVSRALQGVRRALDDGIDIRGYIYWTLLDNFEWARGYAPKFGLVGVDRTDFSREVKPSARWLGSVAASSRLEV